jgi:hypothetical protein
VKLFSSQGQKSHVPEQVMPQLVKMSRKKTERGNRNKGTKEIREPRSIEALHSVQDQIHTTASQKKKNRGRRLSASH